MSGVSPISPGTIISGERVAELKQGEWDRFYLTMAETVSRKSKDPSTKTGAVIVRPDRSVASMGFNGFPQRMRDNPEHYANRKEKYSRIIHCEMNALIFAREQLHGYTLYTHPFMSCDRCFSHLVQAGITRFVSPECPKHLVERWEPVFKLVRERAKEMGIEVVELPSDK